MKIAIYGSVAANILLFALQLVAAVTSGSLSIFSTMADAFMDLLSSVVLMWASRQAAKINLTKYPAVKYIRYATIYSFSFTNYFSALPNSTN